MTTDDLDDDQFGTSNVGNGIGFLPQSKAE